VDESAASPVRQWISRRADWRSVIYFVGNIGDVNASGLSAVFARRSQTASHGSVE